MSPPISNPTPAQFTPDELQALGAAVWAALEEDTVTLHERFFPNGNAPISKEGMSDHLYSAMQKLRDSGVDMG